MAKNSDAFRKVAERLKRVTAPQFRSTPITEDTEIYRDLRIYGDEIVDLVWWLEKEFGVKTNIDPFRYAPHESGIIGILTRRITKPRYESLKVRDILAAIEVGHWPHTN
jgi:hypothetical protein